MNKKCFLCGKSDHVLSFSEDLYKTCLRALKFRKHKRYKYNEITLDKSNIENIGFHSSCYKKVTVFSAKQKEQLITLFSENVSMKNIQIMFVIFILIFHCLYYRKKVSFSFLSFFCIFFSRTFKRERRKFMI